VKLKVNTIRRRGYAEASYVQSLLSLFEVDKRCDELPGDSPSEGISSGPVFRDSEKGNSARASSYEYNNLSELDRVRTKNETTLARR
jgi:hypothetical protein